MTSFFDRFNWDSIKWDNQVLLCIGLLWIAVWGSTLSSIWTQSWNRRQKVFWSAVVTALPVVGLMAYLPFSFRKDSLSNLMLFRRSG